MLMNENAKELLMGTFGSFKNVGEGQRTQVILAFALFSFKRLFKLLIGFIYVGWTDSCHF